MILATLIPFGPVAARLVDRGLRRIGMLSYGIYVYHWPIFLWLDQLHTGPGAVAAGFALELTITWVVAVLLVLPPRDADPPGRAALRPQASGLVGADQFDLAWCIPVAFLLVGVGALGVTAAAPPPLFDFAAAQRTLEPPGRGQATAKPSAASRPPAPCRWPRWPPSATPPVWSSAAASTGLASSTGGVEEVTGGAWVGCGLGIGGATARPVDPSYAGPTRPGVQRLAHHLRPGDQPATTPIWPWCSTPPGT